jgi:hypothetical protein
MYTLDISQTASMNYDEIKVLVGKIPPGVTEICLTGKSKTGHASLIAFDLRKRGVNTLKLEMNELHYTEIASISTAFDTIILKNADFEKIQLNNYSLQQFKKKCQTIKKLIIVDEEGEESQFEQHEAILNRLEQFIAKKKYFKPNIKDFSNFDLIQLRKIIASIPDDQTELDLSDNELEFNNVMHFGCVIEALPIQITGFKFQNIKLHELDALVALRLFSCLEKKPVQTLYFTREEIEGIPNIPDSNLYHRHTIIQSLSKILTDEKTVYLIDSKGNSTQHTGKQIRDYLNASPHQSKKSSQQSEAQPKTAAEYRIKFLGLHDQAYQKARHGWFGFFRRTKLDPSSSLEKILAHGMEHKNRTRKICTHLGWLTKKGQISESAPQIIKDCQYTP